MNAVVSPTKAPGAILRFSGAMGDPRIKAIALSAETASDAIGIPRSRTEEMLF